MTLAKMLERATGDTEHEPSALSTEDLLGALCDKVLRISPDTLDAPDRDRFLLSKGHGPLPLMRYWRKGFFAPEYRRKRCISGAATGREAARRAERPRRVARPRRGRAAVVDQSFSRGRLARSRPRMYSASPPFFQVIFLPSSRVWAR